MKNDFETALNLINKKLSDKEIKHALKDGTDIEKSAVILNLISIDNEETAELLIKNLTNQSGPVREAAAFKLNELMPDFKQYFQKEKSLDTIINSLNDVNPNVVRFMLNTLEFIENKLYIFNSLIEKINELFNEISNKPRRGKAEEHIFTKKCFKIYWSLEAIKKIISLKYDIIMEDDCVREDFYELLKRLSAIDEYTIREKVAQIVNLREIKGFSKIKELLNNDSNYFVKRYRKEQ